jgi:glyoxylase-like metal-dependent hydrolase (beta-lactamase superfamily II)
MATSPAALPTTSSAALRIPESARGPAIDPQKGYLVEEISGGLYWVTQGTHQMMFLTTGEGVIAVDAPPGLGTKVLDAIAEVTDEPITHVVYSHSHADHISAASIYPAGVKIIAHEETATQLARAGGPSREAPFGSFLGGSPVPPPTTTFSDRYTLTVGSQTLELEYRGPAHEPGNIYIHAPAQRVLMLVDVIFPGWTPFADLAQAEDVPAFIQAHDEALSYDFEHFIGGHLTRLGTRADVEMQKEYVLDMRTNAAIALRTVNAGEIVQQVGADNPWLFIYTYLHAMAKECSDLTLAKWGGRLGGVDVFTEGHCFRMVESLRID